MCGHVGVAGSINKREEKAFAQMLVFDSVRGEHSTGAAFIARHVEPLVAKAVGNPFELFDTKTFDKGINRMNSAIIGHNRYATQGAVSRANAHPFEFEHIIGAHNGTLHNKHVFVRGHEHPVDSYCLYDHINEKGLHDAINKANGAWALVWYDKRDKSINFLRNKERPLCYMFSKDRKQLFWASESWMLYAALRRNDIETEETAYHFSEDKHYKWIIPAVNTAFGVPEEEEVKSSALPFSGGKVVVTTAATTPARGVIKAEKPKVKLTAVQTNALTVQQITEMNTFSHRKNVILRPVSIGRDQHGSSYITLYHKDSKFPIRLYFHRPEESDRIMKKGALVQGTTGPLQSLGGAHFYRVQYSTHDVIDAQQEEEKPLAHYSCHDNTYLDEEGFYKRYGKACSWCSSEVDITEGYFIDRSGQSLICYECGEEPEIGAFVMKGNIRFLN